MAERRQDQRHLVVISMDGLSETEGDAIASLPGFSRLLARGTRIGSLEGVYPTLTYVLHATMMTGCYPENHGIDHNHPLQPWVPEDHQNWYWYARELKRPSLFDCARQAGLGTAAVLWPLVSGAPIHWNLPEIAALPGENQIVKALRAGSPGYLLDLQLRFGRYRKGSQQPFLDDFVSRSAAYTIRSKRPGLLMTHLIGLDDAKHHYGSDSTQTRAALLHQDTCLKRILDAVEDAGIGEKTNIVVLGDHGHIDTSRRVRLNRMLVDAGLGPVRTKDKSGEKPGGRPGDWPGTWRFWFRCAGGSAYLHIRDTSALASLDAAAGSSATAGGAAIAEAACLLGLWKADPESGISAVRSGQELQSLRAGSGAVFAIDAEPGVQFIEDSEGPTVEHCPRPGAFGADHGYPPWIPGYHSLFMAAGPGIRQGAEPGRFGIVDVAPTLARMLGIDFPACDGRVNEALFE
jgi:predicted AlkP superfamily pyrophosphatase or phosphodiesterase